MLETTHLRPHLDKLSEKMWTIFSLSSVFCFKLRENAHFRLQNELFRPAELASLQKVVSEIRNDQIFWLDAKSESITEIEIQFLKFLQDLKNEIKNYFRTSLNEVECHYAFYKKDHFYKKHRDITQIDNKRIFSFVLYLNESWQASDGGCLVGYKNDEILFKVKPESGQMIVFCSELEHEVLPTHRDRLSLTGWFRQ